MNHNDGGPAFPAPDPEKWHTEGMSLHQWYVGMAISGLASDQQIPTPEIAKMAIGIADDAIAILAERKTDG